jgi:hypothetical protein
LWRLLLLLLLLLWLLLLLLARIRRPLITPASTVAVQHPLDGGHECHRYNSRKNQHRKPQNYSHFGMINRKRGSPRGVCGAWDRKRLDFNPHKFLRGQKGRLSAGSDRMAHQLTA